MVLPEVKYIGTKVVPRSDFRVGTTSRRINSKEIIFNIGTWNVRRLRQAGRLLNLTSEIDNCEINVLRLSEVQWPKKCEIVLVNYTMFYSGGVKADKGLAVVKK